MLYFVDYKYRDSSNFINKIIGRCFPFTNTVMKEFRKDADFELLELPHYHFTFLKNEECEWLGVIAYYNKSEIPTADSESGVIFISVVEVEYLHHGKEYGQELIEWLQERYPGFRIRLFAKDEKIMNEYYLKRDFKIIDNDNRLLEYTGSLVED